MEIQSVITLCVLIGGFITILGYFKSKEKDNIKSITEQRDADEKQNQKIALLEQRVGSIESNAKELKGEIIDKVERIDSKVDDLKHMLIEFFTKSR